MNPASYHRALNMVAASFAANALHVYKFVVLVKFHLKLKSPPHTVAYPEAAQAAARKLNVATVQRLDHHDLRGSFVSGQARLLRDIQRESKPPRSNIPIGHPHFLPRRKRPLYPPFFSLKRGKARIPNARHALVT